MPAIDYLQVPFFFVNLNNGSTNVHIKNVHSSVYFLGQLFVQTNLPNKEQKIFMTRPHE